MFKQDDKINILVVRFKRIGDAILALPVCNSLKQSFPNATVDYVLYDDIAPLFVGHPYVDNVIVLEKEVRDNIFKYIKKVREVTKKRYNIVIDIMSTPKSEMFTLFSLKSSFRIGRYKKHRGYTYTHRMTEPISDNKVDKFLKQLLTPLSKAGFNLKICEDFKFFSNAEERKEYRDIMEKEQVDFSKPVVAFSIYSRVQTKIYPIEKMKKVVEYLIEKYNAQIIFFYSPDQKEAIQKIHSEFEGENNKNIFSTISTPTIRDLVPFLENCDYFIGNEGGARHLAQGVGIPSLAIYQQEEGLKEWLPYPSDKNMGISPREAMKELSLSEEEYKKLSHSERFNLISIDMIIKLVDKLIENNKRK